VRTRQRSLTTCVSDEPFEIGRRSCCSFVPAMGGTLLQGTKKRTGLGPHPWQGKSRESQRIPAAYVRRSELNEGFLLNTSTGEVWYLNPSTLRRIREAKAEPPVK